MECHQLQLYCTLYITVVSVKLKSADTLQNKFAAKILITTIFAFVPQYYFTIHEVSLF